MHNGDVLRPWKSREIDGDLLGDYADRLAEDNPKRHPYASVLASLLSMRDVRTANATAFSVVA